MPGKTATTAVTVLRPALRGTKLSIALHKKVVTPSAILPGLLYEGQSTFVRVANGVDAQMYAVTISIAIAAGMQLSPFGQTNPGAVLLAYGGPIAVRVLEQCRLLHERFTKEETRDTASKNLHLYHSDLGANDEGSLNDTHGRAMYDRAVPQDCKLAVFFDAARCLSKRSCDTEGFKHLGEVLSEMNQSGIATLVFYRSGRKTDAAFAEELLADCNGYALELTEDRAAPREYGTGFTVKRRKTSEHDTVPTNFQVWYTVMNNELNFGWECRSPDDTSNHKQIEIAERQKRVADLLESGMQQKDIAAALGVNSATVSRDASAVKANAKKSSKVATGKATSKD